MTQRILSTEEWNELCRELDAERNKPADCTCAKPFEQDGVLWKSVCNPGCHVHGNLSRHFERSGNRSVRSEGKRHSGVRSND